MQLNSSEGFRNEERDIITGKWRDRYLYPVVEDFIPHSHLDGCSPADNRQNVRRATHICISESDHSMIIHLTDAPLSLQLSV